MLEKFETTISVCKLVRCPFVCGWKENLCFLTTIQKKSFITTIFHLIPSSASDTKQQQQNFTMMAHCWWKTCVLLTWQSPNTRYSLDSSENLFSVIRMKGGVIHHQRAGMRNKETWSSQIPPKNLLFVVLQHMREFLTTDSKQKDEGCLVELLDIRWRRGNVCWNYCFDANTRVVLLLSICKNFH